MEYTRIVTISQDFSLRANLRSCLERTGRFEVVGEAENGHQGIVATRALHPHLALIDTELPGLSGHAIAALLQHEHPDVRVINLVPVADFDHLFASVQSGSVTAIQRNADPAAVVSCVQAVMSRTFRFHPWPIPTAHSDFADGYVPGKDTIEHILTAGQGAVLDCMLMGLNAAEIAEALGITQYRLRKDTLQLFQALGTTRKVGLIAAAVVRGWSSVGHRAPTVTVMRSAGELSGEHDWFPHRLDLEVMPKQAQIAH